MTKTKPEKIEDNLVLCLKEWPKFVIDLHTLIKSNNRKFNEKINKNAPNSLSEDHQNKAQYKMIGDMMLDQGRNFLKQNQCQQSLEMFSAAKRSCVEVEYPCHRWYKEANFAIITNRATAAFYLQKYNLCRADTRFTLLIKNDHIRTYERLPALADAFSCPQLKEIFDALYLEVQNPNADFKASAKKAIGLLSVSSIIYSRLGELTDELMNELIEIGIDDCFTSVNVNPAIHPILPWLKNVDLEKI